MVSSGLKTKEITDAVAVLSGCGYWYAGGWDPYGLVEKPNPKWGGFLWLWGGETHACVFGIFSQN